jgi:phage baseplate assembly protein V
MAYPSSGEREIRVRGYDLMHRLRKSRHVRSFVQVTSLDIARELAGAVGLSVKSEEPGPLSQFLLQLNQSDLDFLLDQTEPHGLYPCVQGNTLRFLTLTGTDGSTLLALGESLLEVHIEVNSDSACRSVTVTGWDPFRAQLQVGRATKTRIGRRVAAEAPPKLFGSDGEVTLSSQAGRDQKIAQSIAQSELDRRSAGEVVLHGTVLGDPRLRPGSPVEVTGVAVTFSGRYILSSVTHTIDGRAGYVSEISSAPPAPRPRDRNTSVFQAIVTRVNDPERLGRVRVSFPACNNIESDWMHVVSAGAGKGKGLVICPEVNDQVLVLFVHGDSAQGFVLGSFYGTDGPPDPGLDGSRVKRYTLLTPNGQRVQLDDTGNLIRLENKNGSYLELAPEKVRIHATASLEIDAPGKDVVIKGKSIDFRKE